MFPDSHRDEKLVSFCTLRFIHKSVAIHCDSTRNKGYKITGQNETNTSSNIIIEFCIIWTKEH